MGQTRREAQVGLAVIVASVILVVGVLWFNQFRFAGGVTSYAVDFPRVDGLQVRDRVQVRGIRMGRVESFEIVDDVVRVTFHVEDRANLRSDATIRLQTIGIVGELVVEIDPGTAERVPAGHVFAGDVMASMTTMTGSASEALDDLRELAREVTGFVREIRRENRVPGGLVAAASAAASLDTILGENRRGLRLLIGNLEATSGALRQAVASPDSDLADLVAGAARSFGRADSVLANLERDSATLGVLLARLEAGEGTAGRLLTDDRLYARADSTLTAVKELLDDVRRNPKKYFKFSVIDF